MGQVRTRSLGLILHLAGSRPEGRAAHQCWVELQGFMIQMYRVHLSMTSERCVLLPGEVSCCNTCSFGLPWCFRCLHLVSMQKLPSLLFFETQSKICSSGWPHIHIPLASTSGGLGLHSTCLHAQVRNFLKATHKLKKN